MIDYFFSGTYTQLLSHVQFFVTPWTVAYQAPLSMEFFRQDYWSGLSFLSPGNLPNSGIKLSSLMSSELAGRFFTTVPRILLLLSRFSRVGLCATP